MSNNNEFNLFSLFNDAKKQTKEEAIYNKLFYGNYDGYSIKAFNKDGTLIHNILDNTNIKNIHSKKLFLANYCNSNESCKECIFYHLFDSCFILEKVMIPDINKYVDLYYKTYQKYIKLRNKTLKRELKLLNK